MSFSGTRETSLWNIIINEDNIPISECLGGEGPNCWRYFVIKVPAVMKMGGSLLFLWVRTISKHKWPEIFPTLVLKNSPSFCFSKVGFRLWPGLSLLLQQSWVSLWACSTLLSIVFALSSKSIPGQKRPLFCHWIFWGNCKNQGSKWNPLEGRLYHKLTSTRPRKKGTQLCSLCLLSNSNIRSDYHHLFPGLLPETFSSPKHQPF